MDNKQPKIFNNLNEFTEHIQNINEGKTTEFSRIDNQSIDTENMTRAERRRLERSFRKIMKKKTPLTI